MNFENYKELKEIFERMRGKWQNAGSKSEDGVPSGYFEFDEGVDCAAFLQALIQTGEMPLDNPTDFFPTKKELTVEMLRYLDLNRLCETHEKYTYSDEKYEDFFGSWFGESRFTRKRVHRVLEPSGGVGGIAEEIRAICPRVELDVIEFLPLNANILRNKGFKVFEQDFLTYKPENPYDTIVMNPPFSLGGDVKYYMKHIYHAFSLLAEQTEHQDCGHLAAILPTGWLVQTDKQSIAFRDFVMKNGTWEMCPKNSFKEVGTTVDTCFVYLSKENFDWRYTATLHDYPSTYIGQIKMQCYNDTKFRVSVRKLLQKVDVHKIDVPYFKALENDVKKLIVEFMHYSFCGIEYWGDDNDRTVFEKGKVGHNQIMPNFKPRDFDYLYVAQTFIEGYFLEWGDTEDEGMNLFADAYAYYVEGGNIELFNELAKIKIENEQMLGTMA